MEDSPVVDGGDTVASLAGVGLTAHKARKARSKVVRVMLIASGTLSVGLGVLGAVLPVLPTTPFLLLAAACYVRSSRRLHRWLLANRVLGAYIRRYMSGQGLPLSVKVTTLTMLWLSLGASAFLAVPGRLWWVRLLLLAVGSGVTTHILKRGRRGRPEA